jgi:NADH-quinone oxidoreductase subunit H
MDQTVTLGLILQWVVKSLILVFILLTGFAYTTLYERKALARIQVRVGPNRAGPFGFFQPVADLRPAKAYFTADFQVGRHGARPKIAGQPGPA